MKHTIHPKALESVIKAEKQNNGADFTVKSKETGKEFTYKISRKQFKNNWYTFIYVEQEYQVYRFLGSYFAGHIYMKKELNKSISAIAIAWVLSKIEEQKFDLLEAKIELMHLGSCLRCGKTLTDSHSIEIGLGPVCRTINGMIG